MSRRLAFRTISRTILAAWVLLNLTRPGLLGASEGHGGGDSEFGDKVEELVVTGAALSIEEIDFRAEGEGDLEVEVEIEGPIIIELPSSETPVAIDTFPIPPGTYDQVRFEIDTLDDPGNPNLLNLSPIPTAEMAGFSLVVRGYVREASTDPMGFETATHPFVFKKDLNESLRIFDTVVVSPASVTEINLRLDPAEFFTIDGMILDPRDAANLDALCDHIEDLIKNAKLDRPRGFDPNRVKIVAPIEAIITGGMGEIVGIQILGVVAEINESTEFEGESNDETRGVVPDLMVGDRVGVRLRLRGGDSPLVEELEIELGPNPNEVDIKSEIEAVNLGMGGEVESITLLGLTFTIGPDTNIEGEESGADIEPLDLGTGLRVEAKGLLQLDGSVATRKIEVEEPDDDGSKIEGTITEVIPGAGGDQTIVIAGLSILIDMNTEIETDDDESRGVVVLAAGQRVEVRVVVLPGGTLLAIELEIENDASITRVKIEGAIQSKSDVPGGTVTLITIGGVTIVIDAETQVRGPGEGQADASILDEGDRAKVRGEIVAIGQIHAHRVDLKKKGSDGEGDDAFGGSITRGALAGSNGLISLGVVGPQAVPRIGPASARQWNLYD